MSRQAITQPSRQGLVHRAAAAVCPAGQRPWVDAMFAELSAISGPGQRTLWAFGAAGIVASAIEARARTVVSVRMVIGMIVALGLASVCAVLSYIDASAIRIDDDLFIAFAIVAAAALAWLTAIAARKVFRGSESDAY